MFLKTTEYNPFYVISDHAAELGYDRDKYDAEFYGILFDELKKGGVIIENANDAITVVKLLLSMNLI